MAEIIACPECRRRLHLPDENAAGLVRCPSCQTEFPADSVPRLVPSGVSLAPSAGPARPPISARRDPDAERPHARRPVYSSAWSPAILVAAVLGGVVLIAGVGGLGVAFIVWKARPKPAPYVYYTPPPPLVNPLNPPVLVKPPRADDPPLVAADELAPELKPLFTDLGAAARAGDGKRMAAHFDIERIADDICALAALPVRNDQDKRAFARGFAGGVESGLEKQAAILQWDTFEIRSVKKANDREAVAIVRHHHPTNGVTLKFRWWVTRRSGQWQIYDFEDLDVGMRFSTLVATVAGDAQGNLAEFRRAATALREAFHALTVRQDPDAAERKLQDIAGVKLSRPLEAFRQLVSALVCMHRGQFAVAIRYLDLANAYQPDMPLVELLTGRCLNRLGRSAEALPRLEGYRKLLGDDDIVCTDIGESLRNLQRFADAARSYRTALDRNPHNADAFQGLLWSVDYREFKDDIGPRFDQLDDNALLRRTHFDAFAADCVERQYGDLLTPLVVSMTRRDPEYVSVFYYTALLKAWAGQPDLAVPLFKAALRRQPRAELRQQYVTGFLQAMGSRGKAIEAYQAAPDAREAFHVLAAAALKGYQRDALRQLVAAHAKTNATDPLLPWCQACVYAWDGRYALADKTFTAALAQPPDDDTLGLCRYNRVSARYYTGHALEAYRDIGPRDETFRQLAVLAFNDRRDEPLQALLDAHAKKEPDSFDLPYYRMRLQIRQNKMDAALTWLKVGLAQRPPEDLRDRLVNDFLADMAAAGKPVEAYRAAPDAVAAFQTLARYLLGGGKYDDLQRVIEAHRPGHTDDPWLAYYQGQIHLHNQAWDRAAQVLADGWKKAPKNLEYVFQQPLLYAHFKAGRGLQAYAEVGSRNQAFAILARLLVDDKDADGLEQLIAAQRARTADDAELLYYAARLQGLRNQPAESAALLGQAWQRQPLESRRRYYLAQWLRDRDEAGLGLAAYRLAPDRSVAFETLAYRWMDQKKDKELAALLEEHGKEHAEEVGYRYFHGELHLLRGEPDRAADDFVACLAMTAGQSQWQYRDALLHARVKAGKALAAYREAEADLGPYTFDSLANVCVQEKDGKQLQALLDAHRQASPDDPNVPIWEMEIKWLNADYEGVLKLLDEPHEGVFDLPVNRWKVDDRRVRSLLKLKRTADAIRVADAVVKDHNGSRTLPILAHATTGDVKDTMAAAEKLRLVPYQLTGCYQDADLGPLLKSDAFGEFRAKFPEPKDEVGAGGYYDDDDD